jgi:hypothetical protein
VHTVHPTIPAYHDRKTRQCRGTRLGQRRSYPVEQFRINRRVVARRRLESSPEHGEQVPAEAFRWAVQLMFSLADIEEREARLPTIRHHAGQARLVAA